MPSESRDKKDGQGPLAHWKTGETVTGWDLCHRHKNVGREENTKTN